ncbi:hypothetical protein D6D13_10254 [Aureobasidium pullulans]|uniref:Rhodopsin domain-containing protein n=1 Tax=Aureobasidium pullulans TaxID=5580 RepID=A0A4S9C1G9_AURPU|nr:hypothetical protein D6D13_10254 [Aureobasidium pullulans]
MAETRAPYILLGNILPFLLATIFYFGRVYSRALILRTFGWDDWLLTVGWLAALANCIMACLLTNYGGGMHEADVPLSTIIPSLKLLYGTLIAYQISICFTKLSLCALYLKVFTTSRSGRIFLYSVFGFVVIATVCLECVSIFQCNPVRGVWDINIHKKCIDTIPAFYTSTVESVLVDILLIAFAAPKIMRLNLHARQKYALLFTICLGGVPIIASIIRAVRVSSILHAEDKTWVSFDSSIWSAVDANVSIICASVPSLKPLLRQIAPGFMGSTFGTSAPGTSGQYGNTRKSWLDKSFGGRGYELHSTPQSEAHNGSQLELAGNAGRSDWAIKNGAADDDAVSEDSIQGGPTITKSVTVAITRVEPGSV